MKAGPRHSPGSLDAAVTPEPPSGHRSTAQVVPCRAGKVSKTPLSQAWSWRAPPAGAHGPGCSAVGSASHAPLPHASECGGSSEAQGRRRHPTVEGEEVLMIDRKILYPPIPIP